MKKFVLASKSPRRKELLEKAGYAIEVDPSNSEEIFDLSKGLDRALLDVAKAKGQEVFQRHPEDLVISADTIVVDEIEILGKPKDLNEAFNTLKRLSDRTHLVKTALCLQSSNFVFGMSITTQVVFRKLSDEEIMSYVNTGTCLDKAGSYGIQDTDFVKEIHGSYSNVVGMPMELFEKIISIYENEKGA